VGALAAVPAVADSTVYSSGPGNYTFDSWNLISGNWVSDEFTLTQAATITGFTFDVWALPGDSLTSVEYSIGIGKDGDSLAGPTTVSTSASPLIEVNSDGYDIYTETLTGLSVPLSAGTNYYFTLQGAVTTNGDGIFWDENDGSSVGYDSPLGSIHKYDCNNGYGCGLSGGETFTLTGASANATPEPNGLLLLGTGIVGLAGLLRRKFAKAL
jgi:hypothetical protein